VLEYCISDIAMAAFVHLLTCFVLAALLVPSPVVCDPNSRQGGQGLLRSGNNQCMTGHAFLLYTMAPKCFKPCQRSCAAVGKVIKAFLGGGEDEARKNVCKHQSAFECFVQDDHLPACEKLLAQASKMGFYVPRSVDELHSSCATLQSEPRLKAQVSLLDTGRSIAIDDENDKSFDVHVTERPGLCMTGRVLMLYSMAPQCFGPCRRECPAVRQAVEAYFEGGLNAVVDSICKHQAALDCFMRPRQLKPCKSLLQRAKGMGYDVPLSMEDLQEQCTAKAELPENSSDSMTDSADGSSAELEDSTEDEPQIGDREFTIDQVEVHVSEDVQLRGRTDRKV